MSDPLQTPLVKEGIDVVRQATEADAAGDNSGAVRLYTEACTLFLRSMKSLRARMRTTAASSTTSNR